MQLLEIIFIYLFHLPTKIWGHFALGLYVRVQAPIQPKKKFVEDMIEKKDIINGAVSYIVLTLE